MDPVVFELLIFLKLNRRFWAIRDFVDADEMRKNAK